MNISHMIYKRFFSISLTLLACACNSANVIEQTVGSHDIVGKVVNARTKTPISSALVVLTVPQGNSWSLPTSFLVGYGFTDMDGNFKIPAHPKPVKNIRYENAAITIDAYHPDFMQSVEFVPRDKQSETVTVKMKKEDDTLRVSSSACTYNNKEICNIVENYLGIN